jgi:hypothetical protein
MKSNKKVKVNLKNKNKKIALETPAGLVFIALIYPFNKNVGSNCVHLNKFITLS